MPVSFQLVDCCLIWTVFVGDCFFFPRWVSVWSLISRTSNQAIIHLIPKSSSHCCFFLIWLDPSILLSDVWLVVLTLRILSMTCFRFLVSEKVQREQNTHKDIQRKTCRLSFFLIIFVSFIADVCTFLTGCPWYLWLFWWWVKIRNSMLCIVWSVLLKLYSLLSINHRMMLLLILWLVLNRVIWFDFHLTAVMFLPIRIRIRKKTANKIIKISPF